MRNKTHNLNIKQSSSGIEYYHFYTTPLHYDDTW